MASHATVTVNATATLVWKGQSPAGDDLILSTRNGGKDVHFGGSGVTTSNFGFHIPNNTDYVAVHVPYGQSLYGVVGTGTGSVFVYYVNG